MVNAYGGLSSLYKWHHRIGIVALILLLAHPTLSLLGYASLSIDSAISFILPSSDITRISGRIALFIMFVGIVASTYLKISHELFVRIQVILGFTFFIASYHAFFIPGSYIEDSVALFAYSTLLIILALIIIIYRSIMHKGFVKIYKYKVSSVEKQSSLIKLKLKSSDTAEVLKPGQYVFIKPYNKNIKKQSHPFSIVSAVNDKELELGIKVLGDFTESLGEIELGDAVDIEGPYGEFSDCIDEFKTQVWIAGGIGITPFISMAKCIKGQKVDLFYSVRSIDMAYYLEELQEIQKNNSNFRLHLIDVSKRDELKIDEIKEYTTKDSGIWICGPTPMMKQFKNDLLATGISKNNIIIEEFNFS